MAQYGPIGAWEHVLLALSKGKGWVGGKASKKLRRAYMARALAHFETLERTLGPGDLCVDLGANYGTFTKRLAATGATVHAYEPDPDTFEILKTNVSDLPNVILHQEAVAQKEGTLTLHRVAAELASNAEKRSWGSSLMPSERSSTTDGVAVKVVSFQQMLATVAGPIRMIKMDIEGSEVDILHDIAQAPQSFDIDTLFVETHERQRPDQLADVVQLRSAVAKIQRPDIHLYWP
jgi:FkbM family methyltransferase